MSETDFESVKRELDKKPVAELRALASKLLNDADERVNAAINSESLLPVIPVALLQIYLTKSRYKAAFEKLTYAKSWFDKGETQQTDALKSISYKSSISDSLEAIRLTLNEQGKGSTFETVLQSAKQSAQETVQELKQGAFVGLALGVGALWLLSARNGRSR